MSALMLAIAVLLLTYYFLKPTRHSSLPSPGLALPIVGHVYKLVTQKAREDPVNFVWNLYKKYQRNGLMYLRSFNLDIVFVGDFEAVKYLFNHPDAQLRFLNDNMRNNSNEERKVKNKHDFPGERGAVLFHFKTICCARCNTERGQDLGRPEEVCSQNLERFWIRETGHGGDDPGGGRTVQRSYHQEW